MTNEMYRKLGIIGGLGPAASARLLMRVTEFTRAACDQDHLDITVLSRPQIPDRTAYLLGQPGAVSFIEPMQEAALELEKMGCEVLATPCNTAHARITEIARPLTSAHFVKMISETLVVASRLGCTRCGILATSGTRATRVYDDVCEAHGIKAVWPDDAGQDLVTKVIYDKVKAGGDFDGHSLDTVFAPLIEDGCDGLILACTELSVIGCPPHYDGVPIIDALDVLAQRCVVACGAPAYPLYGLTD
ncbi:MAG: amino acid racemase [Eggerthellaceae bacterium]|nr:amino acid racemase [Eggerthellaceae bacterium]